MIRRRSLLIIGGLTVKQLPEQIILFGHLRAFSETLRSGNPPPGTYRDIDLAGVERTTLDLRAKIKPS